MLSRPNNGAGASQALTVIVSDGNGGADVSYAYLIVNTGLSAANGCFLEFNRAANTIRLANGAGSAWLSTLTPGVGGSLSNSQCARQLLGSSGSVGGTQINYTRRSSRSLSARKTLRKG